MNTKYLLSVYNENWCLGQLRQLFGGRTYIHAKSVTDLMHKIVKEGYYLDLQPELYDTCPVIDEVCKFLFHDGATHARVLTLLLFVDGMRKKFPEYSNTLCRECDASLCTYAPNTARAFGWKINGSVRL